MRSFSMTLLACLMVIGFTGARLTVAADDGAKAFKNSCTPCHTAKIRPLDNTHLTRVQWNETVGRMIEEGAEVPKAKKQELLDYLANTHGPAGAASDAGKK